MVNAIPNGAVNLQTAKVANQVKPVQSLPSAVADMYSQVIVAQRGGSAPTTNESYAARDQQVRAQDAARNMKNLEKLHF